jgi:hypothetical protein
VVRIEGTRYKGIISGFEPRVSQEWETQEYKIDYTETKAAYMLKMTAELNKIKSHEEYKNRIGGEKYSRYSKDFPAALASLWDSGHKYAGKFVYQGGS